MNRDEPAAIEYNHARDERTARLAVWLLIAAIVAAYANSLGGPFVFDDLTSIVNNPTLASPARWLSPPNEAADVGGRPLLNLSFALNHWAGGLDPTGFHLVNLAIHVACALLVFGLVRRTLRGPRLAARFGGDATWLALAVAALWALHPLQTESVTYLSQRAESLMGCCLLATLYGFARSHASSRPEWWRGAAVAACWAGMFVKETMVVAPAIAWLFDATFFSASWRDCWRERGRWHLALFASWLPLAWSMAHSDVGLRGVGFDPIISISAYALLQCAAVVRYLRLALWPAGLTLDYGDLNETSRLAAWPAAVVVVALVLATLIAVRRWPAAGFLGCWLLGMLAPTSTIVPIAGQPIAEHRMYLPLLALVVAVAVAAYRWRGRGALLGVGVLAFAAGGATAWRNHAYRTAESIWRDNIATQPENPRGYEFLANALAEERRFDEARAVVRAGITARPRYGWLHLANSRILLELHEPEQAVLAARVAVELMPANLGARQWLVSLFMRVQDFATAAPEMEAAARLAPDNAPLHSDLCYVMRRLGRTDDAVRHGETAVRLAPENFAAHGNLAMALLDAGRVIEAIAHHREWSRLQPAADTANYEFAEALLKLNHAAEAQSEIEAILRQHPNEAAAHNLLGVALANQGRREQARAEFQRALALQPNLTAARANLDAMTAPPPP